MESKVLRADMEEIAADRGIPWERLRGATVLVTGATGTIGTALVRGLCAANRAHGLGTRILACARGGEKARPLCESYGAVFVPYDIAAPLAAKGRVDYLFHCAAMAKSPDMAARPADVAEVSLLGTMHALAFAGRTGVTGMVYLSSMEVYGNTAPALPFVTENDLGALDLLDPRSCYPQAKRMCETLCACHHAQRGVPVKIARLAQTFGAGSSRQDTLAVTQFARSALAGDAIVLHTEGASRGNYCYLADAVRALLLLLLSGENGQAYNVANSAASMTIREMAELVANEVCGGRIAVEVHVPPDIASRGYAPDMTRRLSAEKLEALGWRPKYGLAEMYRRLLADWSEAGTGAQ